MIGTILLIEHDGRPIEWPIHESKLSDSDQLEETFKKMKQMCSSELYLGGTLKLLDSNNALIKEIRGRAT